MGYVGTFPLEDIENQLADDVAFQYSREGRIPGCFEQPDVRVGKFAFFFLKQPWVSGDFGTRTIL